MPENKFKIGITQGDTNGIGWEIILKALADPRMTELFTPVVYAVVSVLLVYIVCVLIDQARIRFLEKPLFRFIETRNYQKQK